MTTKCAKKTSKKNDFHRVCSHLRGWAALHSQAQLPAYQPCAIASSLAAAHYHSPRFKTQCINNSKTTPNRNTTQLPHFVSYKHSLEAAIRQQRAQKASSITPTGHSQQSPTPRRHTPKPAPVTLRIQCKPCITSVSLLPSSNRLTQLTVAQRVAGSMHWS